MALCIHFSLCPVQELINKQGPLQEPILGPLLHVYLVESQPQQDQLLVSHLKCEKCMPLLLIAMATALVLYLLVRIRGIRDDRLYTEDWYCNNVMSDLGN